MEFFHLQRLQKHIEELAELRYREKISLGAFACHEDDGSIGLRQPASEEPAGTMHMGDNWEGWDKYLWLVQQVAIPANWENHDVVGLFDFGRTGGGFNSGFESLLYVNGKPYQGVDSHHQEVFFTPEELGSSSI